VPPGRRSSANPQPGTIGRANLDGSGVNPSFITGANSPLGVEVDGLHLYWANNTAGTIGRANLDGSGVDQSFITDAQDPGDLGVLDVAVGAAHVYWTIYLEIPISEDEFEISGKIGRANLDGSGADPSFITGAVDPEGLAVSRVASR
jgi:virginiamycin B lyase